MTDTAKRVARLRELMRERGIDAYVIPTADFHQSEYVGEYFKARQYITGFSGSYGTAAITMDDGGLWTDGRYFTQAVNELEGSGVRLMKMFVDDTPGTTDYLAAHIPAGGRVGFDGRVLSMGEGQEYEDVLGGKGIGIVYDLDLVSEIWEDRPPLSQKPAFFLEEKYTGESIGSKLDRIRAKMAERGADIHIIASLDDVAWTFNTHGDDIEFFPLALSYAMVTMDGAKLYIDESKLDDTLRAEYAKYNVTVRPYNDIYEDVKTIPADKTVLIDPMKMNYALYKSLPCKVAEGPNPSILMKAMKNDVELENIKRAHIKDGIACTKFMYWVKKNFDKTEITELSASEKLTALRAEQEGFIRDSFEPLQAFGEHAAMMHYSPTKESDVRLSAGQMLLFDTGGGYYEGSTDITRTIALGDIEDRLKKYYTAVCRATLNLSSARFLYGCHGYTLDVLARGPIWDLDLDYQCGTGHGVGYLGSIHEPPTGFRWYTVPSKNEHHPLEPGMVITDEPGIYEEGDFGIRIENEFIVRKGTKNKYGQFMYFEMITWAPIDLDCIDPGYMNETDKARLNDYHKRVYEIIGPHLSDEEREWLKEYTRPV